MIWLSAWGVGCYLELISILKVKQEAAPLGGVCIDPIILQVALGSHIDFFRMHNSAKSVWRQARNEESTRTDRIDTKDSSLRSDFKNQGTKPCGCH